MKKSVFYTDFQNVNLTSVKSAPKNVLPKKQFCNWQNSFLAKTFLGNTFYQDQIFIFEISMKEGIFETYRQMG
jgi:hypothetical protein